MANTLPAVAPRALETDGVPHARAGNRGSLYEYEASTDKEDPRPGKVRMGLWCR